CHRAMSPKPSPSTVTRWPRSARWCSACGAHGVQGQRRSLLWPFQGLRLPATASIDALAGWSASLAMKAILQLQKSKWDEESNGHNDAECYGLAMVGETRETHKGHDYSANNGSADQSSINWIVYWRRGLFRRLGQFKHFRVVSAGAKIPHWKRP